MGIPKRDLLTPLVVESGKNLRFCHLNGLLWIQFIFSKSLCGGFGFGGELWEGLCVSQCHETGNSYISTFGNLSENGGQLFN